jgi:hypothetical protein
MRPALTAEMARVTMDDRLEDAERFRRSKEARLAATAQPDVYDAVTVRLAGADDDESLRRLVELDSGTAPRGPLLVAEVDGDVLAARSLVDGSSVANPFVHTAHLAELLALRSAHLHANGDGPQRRRRFWGAREAARRLVRSYS